MMKKTYLVVVSMFFIVFFLCCSLDAYAYQVKVWDNGDADGKWSTSGNWDPDGVPGPGDTVIFDGSQNADCVVDVPDVNVGSLTLAAGYTGMLTLSYDITLSGDLTVHSASILCEGDPSAVNEASGGTVEKPHGKGIVINAANIFVDADGHISADEQGFAAGAGPEPGDSYGEGGGHGGRGGSDGGHTYGSYTAPTALGSGGLINGIGGGAIKLHASQTVTINGTVSATGGDGGRGGGAGGSIWIIADTLAGSGAITADGGYSGSTDYRGGGGGGGRISLQWNSGNMSFDGILRAKGGLKNQGGLANFGSHGTLYVLVPDNPDNAWQELWNTNRPVQHDIALAPGEYHFDDLYIDPGVTLECQGDIEAINEASGGEAGNPHGSGVTIHAANITVAQDGALSADRLGFYEGQGPEPGDSYGEGGGHGGRGGSDGGRTYGSHTAPTALGSGGLITGIGGGAIKLHVSETVTINGTVSATGSDGGYGGGAGGSIWIIAGTLAGSGAITADGGYSSSTDYRGGGGGGGRISLQWNSGNMSFDGILRAKGGLKNQGGLGSYGSHGTLYVRFLDTAWQELWNANRPVQHDIALAPGEYHFDDLYIDPGVTLECQGDIEAINEASGGEAGNPHGSGVIIHADNVTVAQDGTLSTYGMGFYEGQGPASGINFGKGGGHGGEGGCSTGVYGSATAPSALGSGGSTEGIGGGAVTLHVSDTLTVNGTVLSDGEDHAYGGGAGGSVWIVTDTLAGSGEITANGGGGTHQSDSRISGGGGGRIATYFNQDISSLGASASGGTGLCEAGQPGTIVWESR